VQQAVKHRPAKQAEATPLAAVRDEIRVALEAARVRVFAAIGAHPRPVAGCDVEFNRLLEERTRIVQALAELDTLERFELETFVGDSPDLDATIRHRLRTSLQRASAVD
jgi:hypothetical protein